MLKQKAVLEHKVGDRVYEIHCATDAPLGELFDALMQWKGWVVERMQTAHAEEQKMAEEQSKEEEVEDGSCSEV